MKSSKKKRITGWGSAGTPCANGAVPFGGAKRQTTGPTSRITTPSSFIFARGIKKICRSVARLTSATFSLASSRRPGPPTESPVWPISSTGP